MLSLNEYLFIFLIILFSSTLIILLIKNYKKKFLKNFLDREYTKVQSFHKKPIPKIGGIFIFFFMMLACMFFQDLIFLKNIFYISIPVFFFSILEDIKININPFIRLLILFIIIFFCVKLFNLNIYSVQFYNFDKILNNSQVLAYLFSSFCILFIINGSNFIDGFNGLLGIHSSIIILILAFINYYYGNFELLFISILFLICFIMFLFLNFPNPKIFLGNSGAYLIGLVLAILVILTSQKTQYHKVYPFFFACLLNYIFFETFFSFFRKTFYEKKNPFYPDKRHLHMLVYARFKSHIKTTLLINFFYLSSIIVVLFFFKNPGFLKVFFILQIFLYIIFYFHLLKK